MIRGIDGTPTRSPAEIARRMADLRRERLVGEPLPGGSVESPPPPWNLELQIQELARERQAWRFRELRDQLTEGFTLTA